MMEALMPKTRIAKLFQNGASQAVRLPAEFRFEGTEIYTRRDEQTGDVLLSTPPGVGAWGDVFALMHSIDAPDIFMADRPMNVTPAARGLFDDVE
jgi:antitoxin VapB